MTPHTTDDIHVLPTDRSGEHPVAVRACRGGTLAAVLTTALAASAAAQDPAEQDPAEQAALQHRLDAQDQRIQELEKRLGMEDPGELDTAPSTGFEVVYDKGYVLRSTDPEANPFSLRINGRMQFRYAGFSADTETYENLGTAASGEPINVEDRNDFEIERARLAFTGTWLDPDLHFFMNLDADTDDAHITIFHDYWINYDVCDSFQFYVGKGQVPGSRDWIAGSTRTHFVDRSMATSFFRPDRSVGFWAKGEPLEDFHYHAMVSNGVVAADLEPDQVNSKMSYSASIWWDPVGEYGKGYADLEQHDEPSVRVGSSFMFSPQSGLADDGRPFAETRFARLSDGTRLTQLGVSDYDIYLITIDAAFKYQGLAVNSEWFYQAVEDIAPRGAPPGGFPDSSTHAYGFYADAGFMLIEKKLEPIARVSTVHGDFKDSWEYAVGLNWYIDGTHSNKLSADVSFLDGSPIDSSGPDYRVGDDGQLFRVQWQVAF